MIVLPYITAIKNASFNLSAQSIWTEVRRLGIYFRKKEMINCLNTKRKEFEKFLGAEQLDWLYKTYLPKISGFATSADDAPLSSEE